MFARSGIFKEREPNTAIVLLNSNKWERFWVMSFSPPLVWWQVSGSKPRHEKKIDKA